MPWSQNRVTRAAALLRSTSAPYGTASPRHNGALPGAAGRWRPEPRLSGRESPAYSQPGSDAGDLQSNGGSLPASPLRVGRSGGLERGELPAGRSSYERLPAPPPLPARPGGSRGGSPSTSSRDGQPALPLPPPPAGSSALGLTSFRGIGQLSRVVEPAPRGLTEPLIDSPSLPPPSALPEASARISNAAGRGLAAPVAAKALLSSVLDMDSRGSADLSVLSQVRFVQFNMITFGV